MTESTQRPDLIRATYALRLGSERDPLDVVRRFAVGQSTGTWLPVPGLTAQLRERHEAVVLSVLPLPPADTSTDGVEAAWYLATIGISTVNIGASIPQLLTTLIGNDASTSMQAKLVDLEIPGICSPGSPGRATAWRGCGS